MTTLRTSNERVYVAMAYTGDCRLCNRTEDLRCGVCWQCQPRVAGELVSESPRTHRLWDIRDPTKTWYYREAR